MADESTETVDQTPPGTEVTPSGGIITRTDGQNLPAAPPTDWRATLPAELQQEPTLAKYKSLEEALKGSVHAQKLVGKSLDVPGADAKPEQIAEYRKRAGVPDTPAGYKLTLPTPPEGSGMEIDQAVLSDYLGRMHAQHARPEVVQAGLDAYAEHMAKNWDRWRSQQASSEQEDLSGAIAELEKKWGPKDGPMWKHHQGRAELAIRTLMSDAPTDAIQRVVESANDPEVAHAFSLMADAFIERGFLGESEVPSAMAGETAQQKADEIRDASLKDPNHPLNDPSHPEHAAVMKKYLELNAIAAGPRGREVVAEVRR
jgi:hypothetical protein